MPLDPQIKAHYDQQKALASGPVAMTLEAIRKNADAVYNDKEAFPEVFAVQDYTVPTEWGGVPVRAYRPTDADNLPILIYYHGGGWIMHNIASHDSLCRKLSLECNAVVVNVGYRLAPEFPYPAHIDDSYAALVWVHDNAAMLNADGKRIAVCGDSAGGAISEALCLMSRDRKGPEIGLQIPCYAPAEVLSYDESQSMKDFGDGSYVLSRGFMDYCAKCKDPKKEFSDDPYMNPGKAKDLTGLPKAFFVTAEYDPLRDDGEAYAKLLKENGNDVTLYRTPGATHGFLLLWKKFDIARVAIGKIAEVFRETFE